MRNSQGDVAGANDAKDRFILRFHNQGQRAALKDRAAKNKRTMNAEILFLLEQGTIFVDGLYAVGGRP